MSSSSAPNERSRMLAGAPITLARGARRAHMIQYGRWPKDTDAGTLMTPRDLLSWARPQITSPLDFREPSACVAATLGAEPLVGRRPNAL